MPFKPPAYRLVIHRGVCLEHQFGELLPKYFAGNIRDESTAELLLGLTPVVAQVAPRVLPNLRQRRLETRLKYKTVAPLARLVRPDHTTPAGAAPHQFGDALSIAACLLVTCLLVRNKDDMRALRDQRMHRGDNELPVAGRWTQHRAGPRLIIRCKNTRPTPPKFEFIQQHRAKDLPGKTVFRFQRPQQNQAEPLFSLEWAGDVVVDLLDHSHLVPLFRKRHQECQLVQYLPLAPKNLGAPPIEAP